MTYTSTVQYCYRVVTRDDTLLKFRTILEPRTLNSNAKNKALRYNSLWCLPITLQIRCRLWGYSVSKISWYYEVALTGPFLSWNRYLPSRPSEIAGHTTGLRWAYTMDAFTGSSSTSQDSLFLTGRLQAFQYVSRGGTLFRLIDPAGLHYAS